MNRRDLIQKVVLGTTTLIIMPSIITSCSKDEQDPDNGNNEENELSIDLTNATYSALNSLGGSIIVQGIIIANTPAGYIALDSTCTHQGCTIGYSQAANNFPCPCHGSVFSTTGTVLNGPATTALKTYPVSKTGNTLTITL